MLSATPLTITGPFRTPVQLLYDQTYGGHLSLHDKDTAVRLGFDGAPIEGATHFSQFEPLLAALWGERWFSHGCLSSHFLAMVVEGEEIQALVTVLGPGSDCVRIDAVKHDRTKVLTGTASVGPDHPETELASRLARARAKSPDQLFILDRLAVGQKGKSEAETVVAAFDRHHGDLYPFTLRQKMDVITETISWHTPEGGVDSPWGTPVVPIEMLSVLSNSGSRNAGFEVRQPSIGLFIDLEVRLLGTPVLVGHEYRLEREVVALAESRRTESFWTSTTMVDTASDRPVASILLHEGFFKESYPDYPRA